MWVEQIWPSTTEVMSGSRSDRWRKDRKNMGRRHPPEAKRMNKSWSTMSKRATPWPGLRSSLGSMWVTILLIIKFKTMLIKVLFLFFIQTEAIRRVNQLWANDSLFLRDKLLIPVEQSETNGELDSRNSSNLCSPLDDSGGFKMQPHWTHPLCDSFEEDCIVSPESVKLGSRSSNMDLNSSADTWCSSKDSLFANNVDGLSNGTHSSSHSPLASTKSKHSSMDNGTSSSSSYQHYYSVNDNSQQQNNSHHHHHNNHTASSSTTTAPETPTSPSSASASSSRNCSIVDHSEKSAQEFLSRIDSAIASSKKQAKNKADEQDKTAPWVTFDSDSESSDHRHSSASGTSITRQGRHLRYSLRKLEKAQEELFQL